MLNFIRSVTRNLIGGLMFEYNVALKISVLEHRYNIYNWLNNIIGNENWERIVRINQTQFYFKTENQKIMFILKWL